MRGTYLLALFLSLIPAGAGAEECASTLEGLKKTPRLEAAATLFQHQKYIGFVNGTKGSYVVMSVREGIFHISFYTSGLFDMYAIKDEGPLTFCDNGSVLIMSALGRAEEVKISPQKMEVGRGGPRMTYQEGAMPELLLKLHGLNERALASEQ